jgi:hypothetical protein
MDCRTFHRKLEDYLEGGMDFAARFGMERHAKQCFACEREVGAAVHLRQVARDMRKVSAPADFETALLARIQREKPKRGFRPIWNLLSIGFEGISWRVAGATALVTFLAVGILGYFYFGAGGDRAARVQAGRTDASRPDQGKPSGEAPTVGELPRNPAAMRSMPAFDLVSGSRFGWDNWATPYADPRDSDFVDILVPGPDGQQLIMQLPRTIRMRYGQPSREYFIRNVSH